MFTPFVASETATQPKWVNYAMTESLNWNIHEQRNFASLLFHQPPPAKEQEIAEITGPKFTNVYQT